MAHPLVARLHHAAQTLTGAGLSLLFPPRCVGCGRIGEAFCAFCAQAVEATPHPQCARCGLHRPSPALRCPNCARYANHSLIFTRAAALYTSPLRDAIHAFKYESQPALAPLLARYLVAAYASAPWSKLPKAITAVVPVPLHEQRLADRGYNQSQLLAESFGRWIGLPVQPAWLARIRETRQQVGLGPGERHANVAGAFAATSAVAGQRLLLIDDVYTTGATLRACAEAALTAGSHAVYGLTLAQPKQNTHFFTSGTAGAEMREESDESGGPPEMPWWEAEL